MDFYCRPRSLGCLSENRSKTTSDAGHGCGPGGFKNKAVIRKDNVTQVYNAFTSPLKGITGIVLSKPVYDNREAKQTCISFSFYLRAEDLNVSVLFIFNKATGELAKPKEVREYFYGLAQPIVIRGIAKVRNKKGLLENKYIGNKVLSDPSLAPKVFVEMSKNPLSSKDPEFVKSLKKLASAIEKIPTSFSK